MNDSYSIDIALDYLTLDYLKFHHMKLCIVIALLHMLYPLMKCQRTSVRKLFCVLKKHGFSKSLQLDTLNSFLILLQFIVRVFDD